MKVKIILDSISPQNIRLTTFELKFHRFELPSLNTHRVWSRSSSSSRAIPNSKILKEILADPAMPVFWGKNKAGMQASEELSGIKLVLAKGVYKIASFMAVGLSYTLSKLGLHKQTCNRLIEPFAWSRTIVTATEWDNFFELRCHKDAQHEIKQLAEMMREEYNKSVPKLLVHDEWHLPYITEEEKQNHVLDDLIKMSVARCARVSYLTHDGKQTTKEKDFELYDRLVVAKPPHLSPSEHQARPMKKMDEKYKNLIEKGITHQSFVNGRYGDYWSGNLRGWIQYRQLL